MPDWLEIYQKHSQEYELIVAREDFEENLPRTLSCLVSFEHADVVEFGAGTGRFTRMFAPSVTHILAFDASHHMLAAARTNMAQLGGGNWLLGVALHRQLPVQSESADVTVAGWTLGHFPGWYPQEWRSRIEAALGEMGRILRPGGTAIIVETLGTGFDTPNPPAHLGPYYAYLEQTHGFRTTWIRTDYAFKSVSEAEQLCRFFFGEELGNQIKSSGSRFVPECTGIWWRTI